MANPSNALANRCDLPTEFRLILSDYPRDAWPGNPNFNGLAAFWLDRHLAFRRGLQSLTAQTEARLDQKISPDDFARTLIRQGSGLLGDLIGHHQVEDDAYFPELARLEPRIARGFEMLDDDHHALHDLIDRFAKGANAALCETDSARQRDKIGRFLSDLNDFERMLCRHLDDEEDLVVPVVLKHRLG